MHEAQEIIFISQGSYRSWKTWKVKEVHLPGPNSHGIELTAMEALGKLEYYVIEIRYCRCIY